ncbi:SIR2 family protein [Geomicrobium sp. JSM 1781026]|uniref:SIR2 family protein n=1 Tax=Geomicrobium sp. JSM 1781026 TaxID=3344580 RepID=UPI0035C1AF7F
MKIAAYIEEAISVNPLLVIGSGSSCGAGLPGMHQLSKHLQENIVGHTGDDLAIWKEISRSLDKGLDLETALQSVSDISVSLTSSIVEQTWACIAKDEKRAMMKISMGEDICGFVKYFKKYLHTKNKVLNVVTTNYDQLVEFSASVAGLQYWDGFNTGSVAYPKQYNDFQARVKEIKNKRIDKICHVKVYKPHGSLSWFKTNHGQFVNLSNIGYSDLPLLRENNMNPAIVTPGIGKYLETHQQPYNNIMAEMTNSIQETKSVIFYGFGFNDIHIQGSFTSLLANTSTLKVILSKSLSESFLNLIEEGEIRNFVAIEEAKNGSRIVSDVVEENFFERNIWSFKELLNNAWGDY